MSHAELTALRAQIALTRLTDRPRLEREWQRLRARREIDAAALAALRRRIETCKAKVEALRTAPLRLHYDDELPISAHRTAIIDALSNHQVLILCGATGSGKSTQLPKLCIDAGRGLFGMIGHTQPRRIAARALANRVADELGTQVGGAVGYQVRFSDRSGPQCRVKLMTDGILLRELEVDRDLRRYDTLIIDEAHERSLNIDLLLGVLKTLLPRRPDLKLIITSATIDPKKFAEYFAAAPVIEVSGRSYPVEVRYRPLAVADEDAKLSLPEAVLAAVQELRRDEAGDVLVFLSGEKQIRETAKVLQAARLLGTEILPLYARLSVTEQERIFAPHTQRRIVLATNVAETSLTVPGVRCVVDSGLARLSRYSVRGKVQRLPIEKISQASADQRMGRCGRVAPGICIRLYAQEDFAAREVFTPPEILRTNLASIILKLAMLRLPQASEFPFIDAPELKLINDGYRLLQELSAMDAARQITALGKQIAGLPLDPRLARMLLAAEQHHCLREMLVIAAFLSIQDPRERPQEMQQKADQHHASYADARSDFITVLTLWRRFHDSAAQLSGKQLRKWCREQFLSYVRLREWQEVHRQLREASEALELKPNQMAAQYAPLHQAVLSGFLGGIGMLEANREYLGARGAHFVIAPGTPLASKPPKWLVAASLMETTRMYARIVAAVEPEWIEAAGAHLLKRSYREPHWQAQRGYVTALQSTALYGLVLSAQRRVNYASVAPQEAREIFVRAALVEGQTDFKAEFLVHNRALLQTAEDIEARIRRRDVRVDEQVQVTFYLQHLPLHVHSITALQTWLREQALPAQQLRMTLTEAMRAVPEYRPADYPDFIDCAGNRLPLRYKFEPAQEDDGVTISVPMPLLPALSVTQLAWCVPGWQLQKITELLRALPKALRKHFVPVPQYALQAQQALRAQVLPGAGESQLLAQWIAQQAGVAFGVEELHALPIATYLKPYLRIVDLDGHMLAQGRDLLQLSRALRRAASVSHSATHDRHQQMRSWQCGDLPFEQVVQRDGVRFTVYPALQDAGDHVVVSEHSSRELAEQALRQGVLRLLVLSLPQQYKYVRQQFAANRELLLLGQGMSQGSGIDSLPDALAERAIHECFLPTGQTLPRTDQQFEQLLELHRARLHTAAEKLSMHMLSLFKEWRAIRQALAKLNPVTFKAPLADMQAQLQQLLPAEFLRIEQPWFGHLPRYLKALLRRIERISGNLARDQQLQQQVQPLQHEYQQLLAQAGPQQEVHKLKWMIEELRVSLFAQELKTSMAVSAKRVQEQLQLLRKQN